VRTASIMMMMMIEAVRTSETSVDNHFTRHYNPEDNSEHRVKPVRIAGLRVEPETSRIRRNVNHSTKTFGLYRVKTLTTITDVFNAEKTSNP
jgi:hypothetical protein